jgi:hypothetical protein
VDARSRVVARLVARHERAPNQVRHDVSKVRALPDRGGHLGVHCARRLAEHPRERVLRRETRGRREQPNHFGRERAHPPVLQYDREHDRRDPHRRIRKRHERGCGRAQPRRHGVEELPRFSGRTDRHPGLRECAILVDARRTRLPRVNHADPPCITGVARQLCRRKPTLVRSRVVASRNHFRHGTHWRTGSRGARPYFDTESGREREAKRRVRRVDDDRHAPRMNGTGSLSVLSLTSTRSRHTLCEKLRMRG